MQDNIYIKEEVQRISTYDYNLFLHFKLLYNLREGVGGAL